LKIPPQVSLLQAKADEAGDRAAEVSSQIDVVLQGINELMMQQ